MNGRKDTQPLQAGDPRLVVRWARRYARSRTISFLVQWVVIVLMVLAIGLAASLTNTAHTMGNKGLFYLSVLFMVLTVMAMAWFSLSRWGGEVIWNITQWLYGEEGYASFSGHAGGRALPLWLTGHIPLPVRSQIQFVNTVGAWNASATISHPISGSSV